MEMIGCLWIRDNKSFSADSVALAKQISPIVEKVDSNRLLIGFDCWHERQTIALLRLFPNAYLGVATNRFIAEVAALLGQAGVIHRIEAGEELRFLAPLPLRFLPAEEETLRRLRLLGIQSIGQLAEFSEQELALQFGEEGRWLWQLSHGIDERPLTPERDPAMLSASVELEEASNWIDTGGKELFEPLFEELRSSHRLCVQLQLQIHFENEEPFSLLLNFSRATDEWQKALQMFRSRLEGELLSESPVRLEATVAATVEANYKQLSLLDTPGREERRYRLSLAIERLRTKRRAAGLMRVVFDDPNSRLPERRAHLQSLLSEKVTYPLALPQETQVKGKLAALYINARWREVSSVIESWHIEEEWWTQRPIQRTYYRVSLDNGTHLQLFLEGSAWYKQCSSIATTHF